MVRKYVRKWLPSILVFMVALPSRLAVLRQWISIVNLYTRARNVEGELGRLTGQVDEIAARVDGAAVGARQAAQYLVNGRKGELNEQERRVAEMLRATERVAGAITTAGSDLVVELRQWTRDSKREREATGQPYRDPSTYARARVYAVAHPDEVTPLTDPYSLRECCGQPHGWDECGGVGFDLGSLCRQLPDDQAESK